MARADNSSFLAEANYRRHQAALSAARHAIEQLQRQGQAVTFSTVAESAGVSRGWLYRQDQIRDLISRQRALKPPAARRLTTQRATADSLRRRLDAARAEVTRLRAENRSLQEQLARHLGIQRAQYAEHTPADPR
jgi:chromosome segregation ATPase